MEAFLLSLRKILLMKLFYSLILAAAPLTAAALNVSTEPQPRVAVLEELTGIGCTACPEGHALAAELKAAVPELFIPIAYHAGGYAVPSRTQPDYRTDHGDAMNRFFDPAGYPSGAVNRVPVNGARAMYREEWRAAARAIADQISPVNLWTAATYDAATNKLKVDIEGYFTSTMTADDKLNLNVWILESGIVGYQKGVVDPDSYVHNHMFRHNLTPIWGEALTPGEAGTSFTDSYTYTLPTDYKGITCRPERLSVVVTVNRGDAEVITGAEARVKSPDFGADTNVAASVTGSRLDNNSFYGYDYLEMNVSSRMNSDITSLTFNTVVNGVKESVTVDCLIAPGETEAVKLPVSYPVTATDRTTLGAQLTTINGIDYSTSVVSFGFYAPDVLPSNLQLKIKTDAHASDNRYRLLNASGELVKEFGPYENGVAAEYTEELAITETGVYCLEVSDLWGDGIEGGSVKMYDADGTLWKQNASLRNYGARIFFTVNEINNGANDAIDTIEATEAGAAAEFFDLQGRRVAQPTAGIFIRRAGSKVEKVVVK